MGIRPGTILTKNDIVNEHTKFHNISEGDKFMFVSPVGRGIRVMDKRTGRYYVMFRKHFEDSNGRLTDECIWR